MLNKSNPKFQVPLTSIDRRSENICVLPVIITELELGNIERHVFAAHFVKCSDHAAFEDRPKAFDGLSMNCADDILSSSVVNDAVRIFAVKALVPGPLIGAKQAHLVRNSFADEGGESGGLDVRDHARNHISLAANRADYWSFAGADTTGSTPPPRLSQCLFLAKPPTKVSSTSTMPPSLSMSSIKATRTR
jgi:hypothetical protein